ncbi:MAG: flavodoxin family protein [Clostridia bacterium]|nr:flavodoxin family protein [Clostridia bacterium]
MNVLLVNGSPHQYGCVHTALLEIQQTLNKEDVASEIFWLDNKPLHGCLGCGNCRKLGKCVTEDAVNVFIEKAGQADGFIFGTPVHYAAASGAMTSFMDRVFFSAPSGIFRLKPGAVIVSARRGGCTAAFDQLNKYLTISQMPVISSQYWNMVHGHTPEEVARDAEGLQIMRTLARNMAWFLKCKQAGENAGIQMPAQEGRVSTNFIR